MAYEQKPNSGSLFKNEKKQKPTDKDYGGSALVGGKEYWINAWVQTPKARQGESEEDAKKRRYLKLVFAEKEPDLSRSEPAASAQAPVKPEEPVEDENLPF